MDPNNNFLNAGNITTDCFCQEGDQLTIAAQYLQERSLFPVYKQSYLSRTHPMYDDVIGPRTIELLRGDRASSLVTTAV